jgi:FkbM family methyltransferase
MHLTEKLTYSIRHSPLLKRQEWLWNLVRPIYERALPFISPKGLQRNFNGTSMLLTPKMHGFLDGEYEPEIWPLLVSEFKPGETFVDVGGFIGMYAIAAAQKGARVYVFEPNPHNAEVLKENLRLNNINGQVTFRQAAVSDTDGTVRFQGGDAMSAMSSISASEGIEVQCVALDSIFPSERVDVLKIDVEGFEQQVLQGARRLLSDRERCPRIIFIEVHPHIWHLADTTSESFLILLNELGYQIRSVTGGPVDEIAEYGEVVAIKQGR